MAGLMEVIAQFHAKEDTCSPIHHLRCTFVVQVDIGFLTILHHLAQVFESFKSFHSGVFEGAVIGRRFEWMVAGEGGRGGAGPKSARDHFKVTTLK